jgi:hypothetical protein
MSDIIITEDELQNELYHVLQIPKVNQDALTAVEIQGHLYLKHTQTKVYITEAVRKGIIVQVWKRVNGRCIPAYLPKGKTSWNQPKNKKSIIPKKISATPIVDFTVPKLLATASNTKH